MKDLTIELVVPSATHELDYWYLSSGIYTKDARINTLTLPWSGIGPDDLSLPAGNFITFGRIGTGDNADYRIGRARIFGADLANGEGGIITACGNIFGFKLTEQLQRLESLRQELGDGGSQLDHLRVTVSLPVVSNTLVARLLAKQRQPAPA